MPKIVKTKRVDRFHKPRYSKDGFDSFSFGKSLKSFCDDDLMFTNFVKSAKNENYCRLEDIVINSLYENYSFIEQDFQPMDDVKYTYKTADRLLDIINKGYKHKYKKEDLKNIFKIKHKDNEKFQLFLYKSRGNLTVILIDFFHLAIPSDKYLKTGKVKLDIQKCYNKQSENEWNIKNITNNSF